MLEALLHLFRTVLLTGEVPENMETNCIQHVAENKGSKINIRLSSDCCGQAAIQNICVFGAGRIEATFGRGTTRRTAWDSEPIRRIEEHLLTPNLVLDKNLSLDVPVWIVSLDLSKAFDKVKWENSGEALSEHGVSDHMMLWV